MNPAAGAGSGAGAALEDLLAREVDVEVRRADDPGRMSELAAAAAWEGFDLVAAAGGDGTVGAVASGLHLAAAAGAPPATLAIVPTGTGNDFARHLGLPSRPLAAFRAARAAAAAGEVRAVDLIRCEAARRPGEPAWAINAVVGGLGGRIGDAIDPARRRRWGRLAYLRAGLRELLRNRSHPIRLGVDDRARELEALIVVVGGGACAGGGIPFVPGADPFDGRLDLTVVLRTSLHRLPATALRVLRGRHAEAGNVLRAAGRRVEIDAADDFWMNLDGETWASGAARFEVVPGAVRVAVPSSPPASRATLSGTGASYP